MASRKTKAGGDAGDRLRNFVQRVERLEEEKKGIGEDIKLVYQEAKAEGFDTRTMRAAIRERKKDANDRAEQQALLDTYMHALGETDEAPLFKAVGALAVDTAMRDQVIAACSLFVPERGEIILKAGPIAARIWRDADGEVHAEDYLVDVLKPTVSAPAAVGGGLEGGDDAPAELEVDPEHADEVQAAELGRRGAAGSKSLADNPYAPDDARHRVWADAWTDEVKRITRGRRR